MTIDDLGADQRVDQRRLAGVGRADQRDEAAARCRLRVVGRRLSHRVGPSVARLRASASRRRRACSAARLERPSAFGRREVRQLDGDAEVRIVVRARALDLAIGRRRQAARLAPIPAAPSWGRAAAAPASRMRSPQSALDQRRAPPRSRRRGRPRRSAPRRHRPGSRAACGRPRWPPTRRAWIAAPRSIARATSAQVSLRTRSARRRDSSPSSAFGKARNSMSATTRPSTRSPRNSSR